MISKGLKPLACLCVWWHAAAFAGTAATPGPVPPRRIAILDLVDVTDNVQKPDVSDALRRAFSTVPSWSVISRDTVSKRLNDFNMNPRQTCNNPQCGFDIGNVVQAEYVLFGTSSPLAGIEAVSLKLLHIPTARIAWTEVLEGRGGSFSDRLRDLEQRFAKSAAKIGEPRPARPGERHGKSLAVIDLSENSAQSRAFFERICTRIYGNEAYDLMSPAELAELLTALEINKYSVVPSLENMIGLGQKLGVSNLLYSRLYRDGRSYVYRLAMYDVAGKALVLELPPQPSEDIIKLLDYEEVFFNTLSGKEKDAPGTAEAGVAGKSRKGLWISLGLLGIGGGIAAYWVENLRSGGGNQQSGIPPPPAPPDPDK